MHNSRGRKACHIDERANARGAASWGFPGLSSSVRHFCGNTQGTTVSRGLLNIVGNHEAYKTPRFCDSFDTGRFTSMPLFAPADLRAPQPIGFARDWSCSF